MDSEKLIEQLEIWVKSPIYAEVRKYDSEQASGYLNVVLQPIDSEKPLESQVVAAEYSKGLAAGIGIDSMQGLLDLLKSQRKPTEQTPKS